MDTRSTLDMKSEDNSVESAPRNNSESYLGYTLNKMKTLMWGTETSKPVMKGSTRHFESTPRNDRFDYYIECTRSRLEELIRVADGEAPKVVPPTHLKSRGFFAPPATDSDPIAAHYSRIATLIKMKANEPITVEEHNQLKAMPYLNEKTDIRDYTHVIARATYQPG